MSLLDFKIDDAFLKDLEKSLHTVYKESGKRVKKTIIQSRTTLKDSIANFIYKRVTKRTGLLGQSVQIQEITTDSGAKTEVFFDKKIAPHAYTHLGETYEDIVPVNKRWLTIPVFDKHSYAYPRPRVGDFPNIRMAIIDSRPMWFDRDTKELLFVGKEAVRIPHRISIEELTNFVSKEVQKKLDKDLKEFLDQCLR